MDFKYKHENNRFRCIFYDEQKEILDKTRIVFDLEAAENSPSAWELVIIEKYEQVNFGSIPRALETLSPKAFTDRPDAALVFLSVLAGMARTLERNDNSIPIPDGISLLQHTIRPYLKKNLYLNFVHEFRLDNNRHEGYWIAGVIYNTPIDSGRSPHAKRLDSKEDNLHLTTEWWWDFLGEINDAPGDLLGLITWCNLLTEIVCQTCRYLVKEGKEREARVQKRSYSCFLRALIQVLDTPPTGLYFPPFQLMEVKRFHLPQLYQAIIEDQEEAVEERSFYLEQLLNRREVDTQIKDKLLEAISTDIEHDLHVEAHQSNRDRSLIIRSLIARYYLGRYDIDRAIAFWDGSTLQNSKLKPSSSKIKLTHQIMGKLYQRDQLLQILLFAYRTPFWKILPGLGLLFISVVWFVESLFRPGGSLLLYVVSMTIPGVTILATLIGLVWIIIRFLSQKGVYYIDLLLPRLSGAVIVGFSILVFQDTSWVMSMELSFFNWLIICLASYTCAFVFIFIQVHKTLRLLSPIKSSGNIVVQPPSLISTSPNLMTRSIQASARIFSIGTLQSLIVSILVTSLLYNSLSQSLTPCNVCQIFPPDNTLHFISNWFVLGFCPKLIILWTGLALFIGAFAQLLWHDREITS